MTFNQGTRVLLICTKWRRLLASPGYARRKLLKNFLDDSGKPIPSLYLPILLTLKNKKCAADLDWSGLSTALHQGLLDPDEEPHFSYFPLDIPGDYYLSHSIAAIFDNHIVLDSQLDDHTHRFILLNLTTFVLSSHLGLADLILPLRPVQMETYWEQPAPISSTQALAILTKDGHCEAVTIEQIRTTQFQHQYLHYNFYDSKKAHSTASHPTHSQKLLIGQRDSSIYTIVPSTRNEFVDPFAI